MIELIGSIDPQTHKSDFVKSPDCEAQQAASKEPCRIGMASFRQDPLADSQNSAFFRPPGLALPGVPAQQPWELVPIHPDRR